MAYHAMKWRGGWAVLVGGAEQPAATGLTKPKAWREAKRLARGSQTEAYLHDAGGRIRHRNTYSEVSAHE